MDALSIFIGPAVIAAVITGLVNILLSRRSARLENITSERSKWREQIREISRGIVADNSHKLSEALRILKLHINANGISNRFADQSDFRAEHILCDAHIWALIYRMEEKLKNVETDYLQTECDFLIDYLSLLLKYDWERAKNELNSSLVTVFGCISAVAGVVGQLLLMSYLALDSIAYLIIVKRALFVMVIFLAIEIIVDRLLIRAIMRYSIDEESFFTINKVIYKMYLLIEIEFKVALFMALVFTFPRVLGLEKIDYSDIYSSLIFTVTMYLYVFGMSMISIGKKRIIIYKYNYVSKVHKKISEFYDSII